MKLGQFEIQDYTVNVNGVDENRKMIIYYDLDGTELTRERYYGESDSIPDGYTTTTGAPIRLTLWQFKAQLELTPATTGSFANLKEEVTDLIHQFTGPQHVIIQSAWDNANNISRVSPTVAIIGNQLGLSSTQIDNIFISGSLISL